jgi:hypothetical protein
VVPSHCFITTETESDCVADEKGLDFLEFHRPLSVSTNVRFRSILMAGMLSSHCLLSQCCPQSALPLFVCSSSRPSRLKEKSSILSVSCPIRYVPSEARHQGCEFHYRWYFSKCTCDDTMVALLPSGSVDVVRGASRFKNVACSIHF